VVRVGTAPILDGRSIVPRSASNLIVPPQDCRLWYPLRLGIPISAHRLKAFRSSERSTIDRRWEATRVRPR
jgi:hypothetical protein